MNQFTILVKLIPTITKINIELSEVFAMPLGGAGKMSTINPVRPTPFWMNTNPVYIVQGPTSDFVVQFFLLA